MNGREILQRSREDSNKLLVLKNRLRLHGKMGSFGHIRPRGNHFGKN